MDVLFMFSKKEVADLLKKFVMGTYKDTLKLSFEGIGEVDYRISLNYSMKDKDFVKDSSRPILYAGDSKNFITPLTKLFNIKYEYHKDDKERLGLTEEGYKDYILLSCFLNMQELDFNSPISYFNRLIKSYEQEYKFNEKVKMGEIEVKEEKVNIHGYDRKNMASMESPVSKQFFLEQDGKVFLLPRIHYYISNDSVYIMGIQNYGNKQLYVDEIDEEAKQKNNELEKFHKMIDRYLRKLNKGIDDVEVSKEGKVETIKDVSVSALASLTLFISNMSNYSKFYMPDFLPLRYQNVKKDTEEKEIKANIHQTNITDKFLMTGVRLCEHFDNIECGFENGFLEMYVDKYVPSRTKTDEIYKLYESVKEKENREIKIIRK